MPASLKNDEQPRGLLGTWLDRELDRIGSGLGTVNGRRNLVRGCLALVRKLIRWGCFSYVAILLLHCALMRWVGEHNVFFAFSLYLPPALWFLPAVALGAISVLFLEWRGFVSLLLVTAVTLVVFFGFKPGKGNPAVWSRSGLVVMTNNHGQSGNQSMKPFKNLVQPDVMVLQEAAGTSARYLADPGYAEFKYGRDSGEFALVSKYPILSVDPVRVSVKTPGRTLATVPPQPAVTTLEIAARYVLDVRGRQIVVYNVHLPSPRDTIRYYMRGAFIWGLIGIPGTPLAAKRQANQEGWDQRIEAVEGLVRLASAEKLPVILAGDFNMPSSGWCYRRVAEHFLDSHAAAGAGFGFTFPGSTHNPLSLGGPWMRIDYIWSNRAMGGVAGSVAEEGRASQHRAVAAVIGVGML